MSDSKKKEKKYNKILKNKEALETEKTVHIVLIIITVILILITIFVKPLREKVISLLKKILPFLREIPGKLKSLFKTITSDRNKFTSIMSVFTLAIISGFIFTIINSVENPYDKANSVLWLVLGIFSILPIVFFIIRLRNKDGFFADRGQDSMFGQIQNILTIMKANFKTSATILSVLLAIVIFGLITLSSDNAFVTTSTGIMVMIGVIAMFVGYTIISNSDFFEKYIKNNQVLQLLFNLIFIIPCIIAIAFNWISDQLKNTPSFVYTILLLEIVIIALYFIIPSVDRTLYFSLSNKKSNLNDLQEIMRMNKQQKEDLQKKVFQLKQALFKKSHSQNVKYMNKQGVNDNWDELFKLYSNFESNDKVISRLIDLGFCEKEDGVVVGNCDETLNERVEYIKNTQAKINILQQQINSIKTELSPAEKLVDNTNPNIEGSDDMKEIRDAVVLLMKPVSLKKTTTPKSSEEINLFTNIANQPNYSYALSFWLFVHPQSGHVKDCNNVINFDNRPQILYCPVYKKIPKGELVDYIDDKGNKITKAKVTKSTLLPNNTANYNLESMDGTGTTYSEVHHSNIKYKYPYSVLKFVLGSGTNNTTPKEYTMPNLKMQKWNNIVVNFIDGTYDLFVNGEMVNSFQGVMEDFNYDNIKIGEDNGVSGGIANILFYKNYLTKDKIISNYNLLKNKNPPIISDLLKV